MVIAAVAAALVFSFLFRSPKNLTAIIGNDFSHKEGKSLHVRLPSVFPENRNGKIDSCHRNKTKVPFRVLFSTFETIFFRGKMSRVSVTVYTFF